MNYVIQKLPHFFDGQLFLLMQLPLGPLTKPFWQAQNGSALKHSNCGQSGLSASQVGGQYAGGQPIVQVSFGPQSNAAPDNV